MYLDSLSIKNYRKFGDDTQTIQFAHCGWNTLIEESEKITEEKTEKYLSKSTTLMVGKNNSGKSTIITLLNSLKNTKCGASNVFDYSDFNLNYLRNWYEQYIIDKAPDEIRNIKPGELPSLEFHLRIGIDDSDDVIGKFEDVLILRDVASDEGEEETTIIDIVIKYEVNNMAKFLKTLSKLNNSLPIKLSKLELDSNEIKELELDGLEDINIEQLKGKDSCFKVKKFIEYYEEEKFRRFLQNIGGKQYELNFYPDGNDIPAKDFSLAPLLKVKTIDANTVKDGKTLSNAYNKIVSTYLQNNQEESINEFLSQMNFQVKGTVDAEITKILQDAITSIESAKNLKMNLQPDLNLKTIFNHGIIYEYQENGNYIPENQFGLGYTNLMVIISEIVDYIQLYGSDDINGAVNVLCIEEPETFMHPQMQELFIKNISKAVAKLLGNKGGEKLDTFQIIITTHSSAVLNSKIHSGNTLDNIIYLSIGNQKEVISKNIKDEELINNNGKNIDQNREIIKYIKKYLRLEASDIFFADAVILVEGATEETYIRYLIDLDETLNNQHIKVYRIDGAHSHMFRTLLRMLNMRTIIYTDLDLKRSTCEKNNTIPITDLTAKSISKEDLSTNASLNAMANKLCVNNGLDNKDLFIVDKICGNEWLEFVDDKVTMFSQGKIQGNFATSFEEAVILTNCSDIKEAKYKKSIISLLNYVRPGTVSIKELTEESNIVPDSYKFQALLSGHEYKTKFSTGIIYLNETDSDFFLQVPMYIEKGLQQLRDYFKEDSDGE